MRDNRYSRKPQHIYKQKKRHAVRYNHYDAGLDEREERRKFIEDLENGYNWNDPRNGGYHYWEEFYLTGPRAYAKSCTNRKIRAKYRDMINREDPEHIMGLKGSQYEKEYDFRWTLY